MSLSIRHPKAPARGSRGRASQDLRSTLLAFSALVAIVAVCASCELVMGNIPDKSGAAGATPSGTSGSAGGQGGMGLTGTGGALITDANGERCPCDCDGDGYLSVACTGGNDCDDANPEVYPGQTIFFDKPTHPTNGNFDYDCSTKIEPEIGTVNCSVPLGAICDMTTQGFLGQAPPCGQMGKYGHCVPMGVGCAEQVLQPDLVLKCH